MKQVPAASGSPYGNESKAEPPSQGHVEDSVGSRESTRRSAQNVSCCPPPRHCRQPVLDLPFSLAILEPCVIVGETQQVHRSNHVTWCWQAPLSVAPAGWGHGCQVWMPQLLCTDWFHDVITDGSSGHDTAPCATSALTLSSPSFIFDFNIHEEECEHWLDIIRDGMFQQKSMTKRCFPITFRALAISRQIEILGIKMKSRTKTSGGGGDRSNQAFITPTPINSNYYEC